ncbi:ribonuclease 3-like [Achlya hypogyna]|uniref:Ribonuclease 3-like n=1 Tax=Achlya hypogyna TaxID=1202772 RepID=A0A1V9YHX8_ACHHY|nr:ribonuclease 3-like [Achlya hypogyna]
MADAFVLQWTADGTAPWAWTSMVSSNVVAQEIAAKTTIVVDDDEYIFDGFLLLCPGHLADAPPVHYTRNSIKCTLVPDRQQLPLPLRHRPAHADACMHSFEQFLLGDVLRIPIAECPGFGGAAGMHIYPRFVSRKDQTPDSLEKVLASNRLGFGVGRLLPMDIVADYLDATARCTAQWFLGEYPSDKLLHHVVSTDDPDSSLRELSPTPLAYPRYFRIDAIEHPEVRARHRSSMLHPGGKAVLMHKAQGACNYDGVTDARKSRAWTRTAPVGAVSPEVRALRLAVAATACYLTGLKADVIELATALPLVTKALLHAEKLRRFEDRWGLRFRNPTLLPQAFTHASYVDCAVASVNCAAAVAARVHLGLPLVAPATSRLKRKAPESELESITQAHTDGDFAPLARAPGAQSYERLEFLGDTVLSLLVATTSFLRLTDAPEGQLSETRSRMVSNDMIGEMALALHLDELLLSAFDAAPPAVVKKLAADALEAVVGAVFLDQGLDGGLAAARRLVGAMLAAFDEELCELIFLPEDALRESLLAVVDADAAALASHPQAPALVAAHAAFHARSAAVRIERPHLWLLACTHKSFKRHCVAADAFVPGGHGNYERLEFLGDAVLEVVATFRLLQLFPFHQVPLGRRQLPTAENLLSNVRSALVSNARLAAVGAALGLAEVARLGDNVLDNGIHLPGVVADMVEASLAASFLETVRALGRKWLMMSQWSLQSVASFFDAHLAPLVNEVAVRNREWMSPRQRLVARLHKWNPQTSVRVQATTPWLETPQTHAVALYLDGYLVCRASAKSKDLAWDRLATKALRLLGV